MDDMLPPDYSEYMPSLLRRTLSPFLQSANRDSSAIHIKPFSVPCYAAVLFADISGFTRLSSSMNAEELKKYINQYFSKVLGIVERHHGDVIKFCGDSVLILWPLDANATEVERATAVSMATKCAINLIHSPRLSNVLNLKLHCGISAGIVHCMHLGSRRTMEFLVAGEAVQEAGLAANESSLEEVCWSASAHLLVSDKFAGIRKPLGNMLLTECVYYDSNCPQCALYGGLYRTAPSSPVRKRSSPQAIRIPRSVSSSSSVDHGVLVPIGSSGSPSTPSLGLLSPRVGSPRNSPMGATDRRKTLSPRATDLLLSKTVISSSEKSNSIALPHLEVSLSDEFMQEYGSPGKQGVGVGGQLKALGSPLSISPLSGSPLMNRLNSSGGMLSATAGSSAGTNGLLGSVIRISGATSTSGMSSGSPHVSGSLGGGNQTSGGSPSVLGNSESSSFNSDNGRQLSSDAEQFVLVRGRQGRSKSILDNITESIEGMKSNFSSIEGQIDDDSEECGSLNKNALSADRVKHAHISSGRLRSMTLSAESGASSAAASKGQPARYTIGSKPYKSLGSAAVSSSGARYAGSSVASSPITDMCDIEATHAFIHLEERRQESSVISFLSPFAGRSSCKHSSDERLGSDGGELDKKPTAEDAEALQRKAALYRMFLPTMNHDICDQDGLDYMAEVRLVTTMFIEILDADAHFNTGNIEKPQKAIRTILSALRRFGGFLRQFVLDDKGCVAIVGFGVRGYGHDDNASRAIETAASIRRQLQQVHMNCKIGIAMGNVFCGLVGWSYRCEYTMMGSSVNLAARLMGKCAPGQILVADLVRNATQKVYIFEELPRVKAKGYALPIAVFSPISRNTGRMSQAYGSSAHANIFIGRNRELSFFEAIVINTAERSSKRVPTKLQAHVIEGPAGIGKSWLVAEIQVMCSKYPNMSTCVATATTPSAFDVVKYGVIAQMLEQLFGISDVLLHAAIASRRLLGDTDVDEYSPPPSRVPSMLPSQLESVEHKEGGVLSPRYEGDEDERNRQDVFMVHVSEWFRENVSDFDYLQIKKGSVPLKRVTSNESIYSVILNKISDLDDVDDENGDDDDDIEQDTEITAAAVVSRDSHSNPCLSANTVQVSDALALLNAVIPVKFPVHASISALSSDDRAKFREALLVFIISKCIENIPILLVVERIHWCDVPSLNVIFRVLQQTTPLFCCTMDPSATLGQGEFVCEIFQHRVEDSDPLSRILGLCVKHTLPPFTHDEINKLLTGVVTQRLLDLEPSVASEHNIALIHARTAGSPLLTASLCLRIKEAVSSCTYKNISSLVYGHYDMSINNFDSLSKNSQLVLKVASIIGMSFSEWDLASLMVHLRFMAVDIDVSLMELQTRSFITVDLSSASSDIFVPTDDAGMSTIYRFLSSSVYENVNHLILETTKSKAHGLYAKMLEDSLIMSPELLEVVIDHFGKSDLPLKKNEYYNRGLEQAKMDVSCSMVEKYTDELVLLFTYSTISGLLQHCCTPEFNSKLSAQTSELVKLKEQVKGVGIPTYLRVDSVWMNPKDFIAPVPHADDAEFLSGYVALSSVVDFRRGLFRQSHNKCLLALQGYGLLQLLESHEGGGAKKRLFTGRKEESVSVFLKSQKFARMRSFKLATMRLIVALYIELGIISMLFARQKTANFYFMLSFTLMKFTEKNFPGQSFYDTEDMGLMMGNNETYFPVDVLLSMLSVKDTLLKMVSEPPASPKRAGAAVGGSGSGAVSSNPSSLKTDRESTSPDWDINDSVDDTSAALSRARSVSVTSESNAAANFSNSKFAADAAKRFHQGLTETAAGKFSSAYTSFGWAIQSLNIDTDDFGATFRHMIILQNAWVALLVGNIDRSKIICKSVLEYFRAFKQVVPCKWALELDMLHQLFGNDFSKTSITSAIEHSITEIKSRARTDTISPCSCAILAFSLAMDKIPKRALPLVKFAVSKLCQRPAFTVVPGIFLFLAGFAAALMIEHDNTYFEQLPADVSIHYRDQTPRVFHTCKEVVSQALSGLSIMVQTQPCLTLLYDALSMKYMVALSLDGKPNCLKLFSDDNLSKFNEFVFGKAFVQMERFNFVSKIDAPWMASIVIRKTDFRVSADLYFKKLCCPPSSIAFFSGSKQRNDSDCSSNYSVSSHSISPSGTTRLSLHAAGFWQRGSGSRESSAPMTPQSGRRLSAATANSVRGGEFNTPPKTGGSEGKDSPSP